MTIATKHAERRISERYSDLSKEDLKALASLIEFRKSNAKLLYISSIVTSAWKVFYKYRWVCVVYDRSAKTIITILPGRAAQNREHLNNRERFITTKDEPRFDIPNEWKST